MSEMIYASPDYSMGATSAANVPATKKQAEVALKKMQKSLKGWLKVRQRMDSFVARNPTAPVAASLRKQRFATEQDLAENLYSLLFETGIDPSSLPSPDVSADPGAAVKLANVAIAGKAPSEVASAQAQGIAWFVLAIPVAGVVLVLSQFIKSKAEVAKAQEERICKQSGDCTDEGFWLKWGAIAVISWLAWDKFGLREAVEKRKRK